MLCLAPKYHGHLQTFKMSQILHEHISDQKLYLKEMRETSNKYKLSVYFSKDQSVITLSPYITQMRINLSKCNAHIVQFTCKVDPKMPSIEKLTQKVQRITQVLLLMVVTFRICGHLIISAQSYALVFQYYYERENYSTRLIQ